MRARGLLARMRRAAAEGVMRQAFVAWIVFGLVLLGLSLATAYEGTEVSGQLSATDQEVEEGYFALGRDTMLVAKPGSGLHLWLRSHLGERLTLTIAPDKSE